MKKERKADDVEMRAEYDFSTAVRNPYVKLAKAGTNLVLIEPELYMHFRSSEAVNEALRLMVKVSEKAVKSKSIKHAKAS